MAQIGKDIGLAKDILIGGDIIGIPTETVYGLAANAFDVDAVTKVFTAKERPSFDPLIVHTDTLDKVAEFVEDLPGVLAGHRLPPAGRIFSSGNSKRSGAMAAKRPSARSVSRKR